MLSIVFITLKIQKWNENIKLYGSSLGSMLYIFLVKILKILNNFYQRFIDLSNTPHGISNNIYTYFIINIRFILLLLLLMIRG